MKLVFASNNQNKIVEIRALLPADFEILSLHDIGCDVDIPETANTIEGNAILKANYVTSNYGYDCFADDTGLEVDQLAGEPGVYSARYAGDHKSNSDNIDKLLNALTDSPRRDAQFKTVIALNIKGQQHLFTGIIRGQIARVRAGASGFGYDPVFIPNGYLKTFAEMPMLEKSAISHRGIAAAKLVDFLKNQ